jgi:hypothetical protein
VYNEPRYLRAPWAFFLGKLDDAQYPIEVIQHPICSGVSRATHICATKHWPEVGFASVLIGDVQDILTYKQV